MTESPGKIRGFLVYCVFLLPLSNTRYIYCNQPTYNRIILSCNKDLEVPELKCMTKSTVVFTQLTSGEEAGTQLGNKINEKFTSYPPDVVILFASSIYQFDALLAALQKTSNPRLIVGGSSAGEFTGEDFKTDSACAVAIYSDEMKFNAGVVQGIQNNRKQVARELHTHLSLSNVEDHKYRYHTAMIFADALSGYTDELIGLLTELTTGEYQFFGGGAGDNANFLRTHVFFNGKSYTDAAVILEIGSNKPVGIGISHGWQPISKKMRVTEADGRRLISLNARPAVEVYKQHALDTGNIFDIEQPIPFFLSNIIGIEVADGFKLRAPIGMEPDGTIIFASDIPVGASVYIMGSTCEQAKRAAVEATSNALAQLQDHKPNVAIFFDCVATRLRMGNEFELELEEVSQTLNGAAFAGCNTYGQVARVNGQFSGFQNCSAVVCIIPD
jgi:hypothetical protein